MIHEETLNLPTGQQHLRYAGPLSAPSIVFLHGWPQASCAWNQMLGLAASTHRCYALDLPGIGGSVVGEAPTTTNEIAAHVRSVIDALGLKRPTLVGQDIGGMVTYAYLKRYSDLRAAVIMNTVVPGIAPWEKVLANPYVWHFAFHSIPSLPELLVGPHVREYFDYFYDAIAHTPDAVRPQARERYAAAYARPAALATGFGWYRSLWQDAADNQATHSETVSTPVLYLRGEREGGDLEEYRTGLRAAGLLNLTASTIPGGGHWLPEEAPVELWRAISDHLRGI